MTDQYNLHMTIDAAPVCLSYETIGRTANMQLTSVQDLCKSFTYKRASNTMAAYKTVAIVLQCIWEISSQVRFSSYLLLRGYKKNIQIQSVMLKRRTQTAHTEHWTGWPTNWKPRILVPSLMWSPGGKNIKMNVFTLTGTMHTFTLHVTKTLPSWHSHQFSFKCLLGLSLKACQIFLLSTTVQLHRAASTAADSQLCCSVSVCSSDIPCVSSWQLIWCSPLLDGEQLRTIRTWHNGRNNYDSTLDAHTRTN